MSRKKDTAALGKDFPSPEQTRIALKIAAMAQAMGIGDPLAGESNPARRSSKKTAPPRRKGGKR